MNPKWHGMASFVLLAAALPALAGCAAATPPAATAPAATPAPVPAPAPAEPPLAPLPPLTKAQKRVMAAIGAELMPDQNIRLGEIVIDRRNKELRFPAILNMRGGDLEVLITTYNGRNHESLLTSGVDAFQVQLALILLGANNGARSPNGKMRQGTICDIDVAAFASPLLPNKRSSPDMIIDAGVYGLKIFPRQPIEGWLTDKISGDPARRMAGWVFVGSSFNSDRECVAQKDGNIVNIWSFGNSILDNPDVTGDDDVFFAANREATPPLHTPVLVFIKPRPGS